MIAALALALATSAADRPWQVRFDAGIGSAVGFAGADLVYAPSDSIRLEAGAGRGYTGWQLSLMPKYAVRVGEQLHALFGFGPSLSLEPLDPRQYASEFHQTGVAVWLNADAGFEYRFDSGLTLSVAAGLTAAVYGNYLKQIDPIDSTDFTSVKGLFGPQGRVGVGYSF